MLRFVLEQNILFYAMTVVCILGVLSQNFLGRAYGKLTKDASRGGQAQGKLMKQIRQRLGSGQNPALLVESSLTEYRIWGQSFHSWQRMGFLSWVLVLAIGGFGWYFSGAQRMGTQMQQRYLWYMAAAGVLTALAYLLADTGYRRKRLATGILDYAESMAAADQVWKRETKTGMTAAAVETAAGEEEELGRACGAMTRAESAVQAESARGSVVQAVPRERRLKLKESRAQREKRELKENMSRIKEGLSESAASQEKEHNAEILKQMDPKEQERVIREVLKEFLS